MNPRNRRDMSSAGSIVSDIQASRNHVLAIGIGHLRENQFRQSFFQTPAAETQTSNFPQNETAKFGNRSEHSVPIWTTSAKHDEDARKVAKVHHAFNGCHPSRDTSTQFGPGPLS